MRQPFDGTAVRNESNTIVAAEAAAILDDPISAVRVRLSGDIVVKSDKGNGVIVLKELPPII